ncbi:hypothetical protein NL448_29150, partial [Klebsiella pneumoniae]|nr:hypothetical protein [Klebsiella pneumoniae]
RLGLGPLVAGREGPSVKAVAGLPARDGLGLGGESDVSWVFSFGSPSQRLSYGEAEREHGCVRLRPEVS